jgi:putative phage-type endonuclease
MKLPKIVPLEQRTPEWHAWRAGTDIDGPRITATDVPAILGVSKFATPYELWLKKTGRAPPQPMNWAMRRGVYFEPVARALVEKLRGQVYLDVCVEHPDIAWAAASLDGLTPLCDELLEIKVPGEEAHALAILGEVPPWYYPQVQWQLMCCPSVSRAFYASFVPPDEEAPRADPGAEGTVALVEVLPDPEFQAQARIAAEAFRQCLIEDVPPCGEEFLAIAAAYDQLREQNKEVEERLATLEARLKGYVNVVDRQVQGGGITVTQSIRKGSIDLKAYLKSKSITIDWSEAESFRGPTLSSVSLHYKPGVAFPILKRSLGLLPPEPPSPENGNTPGVAATGVIPGVIPGPTHDPAQDQDQELEAALLI